MIELLNKGGWIMYPILLCSVIALATIIERIIFYLWTKEDYEKFFSEIKRHILTKNIDEAIRFAQSRHTAISKITVVYLKSVNKKPQIFEDILHHKGSDEVKKLERHLFILAIVGHLTPLIGLLGTVLGMIVTFQKIESLGGQVNVNALAGGIWVALLTTAFGLIVAIPVMAAYHFFENLVTNRSDRMQSLISELNDIFDIKPIHINTAKDQYIESKEEDYETIHP